MESKEEVPATLAAFAFEHLRARKKSGLYRDSWLRAQQVFLSRACDFMGPGRALKSITVRDVEKWQEDLRTATADHKALSSQSVLHHLNTLSGLFRRAERYGLVRQWSNPMRVLLERPTRPQSNTEWYEVHQAALVLEAARTLPPLERAHIRFGYELLATMLLTGGRRAEVLGLEVDDVSFDRRTVTFRPNRWRRLKTVKSARVVPLWPQLEEILRPYVFGMDSPPGALLFPTVRARGREAPVREVRKLLDRIGEAAGLGTIRTKPLRHTYITARLQTLDNGRPVSLWTVAREVGHASPDMIEKIYGHLGAVRHRSEVVEFRVHQHRERLAEPLEALRARIAASS